MFETLVNYRVENALKVGPRYILMLVLYLLHAEFELAKKILHILIFFACERETSVEVGKSTTFSQIFYSINFNNLKTFSIQFGVFLQICFYTC